MLYSSNLAIFLVSLPLHQFQFNLYQFVSKVVSNSASHVLFQQTYHSAVVKTYTTYLKSRIQTFNRGEEQ